MLLRSIKTVFDKTGNAHGSGDSAGISMKSRANSHTNPPAQNRSQLTTGISNYFTRDKGLWKQLSMSSMNHTYRGNEHETMRHRSANQSASI